MDRAGRGQFFAESLFDGERWRRRVRIEVDGHGLIEALTDETSRGRALALDGPVIPAIPNLHSHAFQRAMAGLAEFRGSPRDDFWSWRETMYGLAGRIRPGQLQAVAAQLYLEMLEAGFTQVCEFHYLHNDVDGQPYADPAETAWRLLAAAREVGIGLTLLPVLYQHGGFDRQPLDPRQQRFHSHDQDFLDRLLLLAGELGGDSLHNLGMAFHSLRAVPLEAIRDLVPELQPDWPVHVHIAEQTAEVDACLAHHGRRPVALLDETVRLDRRWCLVHATHVDDSELACLADRGVVVGLCPTTEANLGDGLFPLSGLAAAGGAFGIGSDSHVSVSAIEELRWLEYGQRLRDRARVVVAEPQGGSCGQWLWSRAAIGGAQASARPLGRIEPGRRADWLMIDPCAPGLLARSEDRLLDALVFAGNRSPIRSVFVAGEERVSDGRHPRRDSVLAAFREAMEALAGGTG